jgi:hypothetical protein
MAPSVAAAYGQRIMGKWRSAVREGSLGVPAATERQAGRDSAGEDVNCAGIDFSSLAIDVVLVDLDDLAPPVWHRFELSGQDAFDRTRSVSSVMPSSSFWDDTLGIGIEHPAGKFGVGPMMRVQGAVLACLPAGVLVQPWAPSRWRAACGLSGRASKEQVRAFGLDAFGGEFRAPVTQDCFDAYCIALATRAALVRPAEAAA